jgi:gas vesicle protein
MNTQRQVFEKLAKQNFGAIEDAIEQSQSEASNWIDTMKTTYNDLENTISEALDTIMVQIDILDEYSKELQADYLEANENFIEINKGLLDNNIDGGQFNEDYVKEMTSNFQDKISNVVRLVNMSYEMART